MKNQEYINKCPFCGNDSIELVIEKHNYTPKNSDYMFKGDWWIYKCNTCNERFTTTESDTISEANIKKVKIKTQIE